MFRRYRVRRLERRIAGLSAEASTIVAVLKPLEAAPCYLMERLIEVEKLKGEYLEELRQIGQIQKDDPERVLVGVDECQEYGCSETIQAHGYCREHY